MIWETYEGVKNLQDKTKKNKKKKRNVEPNPSNMTISLLFKRRTTTFSKFYNNYKL